MLILLPMAMASIYLLSHVHLEDETTKNRSPTEVPNSRFEAT
jgi:hypothetical protein